MSIDKQKHRAFRLKVCQIFWEEWDPIGINDFPESQDEYDAYARTVCTKLWAGESKENILDYMFWVQSEYMGIGGDKDKIYTRNAPIVDKMFNLHSLYKDIDVR